MVTVPHNTNVIIYAVGKSEQQWKLFMSVSLISDIATTEHINKLLQVNTTISP